MKKYEFFLEKHENYDIFLNTNENKLIFENTYKGNIKNINLIYNKIPQLLQNYINTEEDKNNGNINFYKFALNLKNESLYEYLINNNLKHDEIIKNIFPYLNNTYTEEKIIIDTTINPEARIKKLEELKKYEYNIKSFVDNLYDNVKQDKMFDNKLYYYFFKYISRLNCLYSSYINDIEDNLVDFNNVYILDNDNDEIGLNTWLYSFFKGIILIRTSIIGKYLNNDKLCAFDILINDIKYYIKLNELKENNEKKILSLKKLYYNILKKKLDTEEKELFIFLLFINIRELSMNKNFLYTFDQLFSDLFRVYLFFF